jgi:hypothetical protein
MSEDELLHTLGNLARFDERWDRLAAGTVTPEEDAELRALAATDPDAREAYEAFRPLEPAFLARVQAAIQTPAVATAPHAAPTAKVLPFRGRAGKVGGWIAAAAAIAALLTFFVRPPALPDYALAELSGGTRTTRGAAPEAAAYAPGDRFQVALRPQTGVKAGAALEARAFLGANGALRPVAIQSQFDSAGSVKVEGILDSDLAPADWTLWLIVGRPGAAPSAGDLPTRLADGRARGRGWVAVPVPLRITPRAP